MEFQMKLDYLCGLELTSNSNINIVVNINSDNMVVLQQGSSCTEGVTLDKQQLTQLFVAFTRQNTLGENGKPQDVMLYTYWDTRYYNKEPVLSIWNMDYLPDGCIQGPVVVANMVLPTPPSASQITKNMVDTLRKEQGVHQASITELESRIQNLLCIEYKPDNTEG